MTATVTGQTCVHCGRQGSRGFELVNGGTRCSNGKACNERVVANVRASQRFTRQNYGTGHGYRLDGFRVPGVTTVNGRLDKSGPLKKWAAECAATEAVENWDELAQLPIIERWKRISTAYLKVVGKKATRGTKIHALGERVSHGLKVDVPDELAGPVQAYAKFLDRWQIETLHTETPVCHTGYRYGGTFDGIASSPLLLDGQPFMLDIKTGFVGDETALQLAAYRHCDLALIDDREAPMPETAERAYVARIGTDDVEMLPVDAGTGTWKTFLHLLPVHRWKDACKDDPPIGRAIWPETEGGDR